MDILVEKLAHTICKYTYPIIVNLYTMFEKLSTFPFLTNEYIHKIWNNIYTLVGVIVLFAVAIKLISTIVNPDLLTDNKKGTRVVYFRLVLVVVLIFLIPILFDYSFRLQEKLIDSNFLISHIFGYKIADGTKTGQLLSWTTFSSFCTLPKDASTGDKYLYGLVQQEISLHNVAQLFDNATLDFHPILASLSGLLVAYELFLLCMDTLFRAAKLAFLELMVPIVLGAYVFNDDILKKWTKEFFSTYLSLFLKVVAMGFMIISFVAIKARVEGSPLFQNNIYQGLFYLLFVIALLQLVKKLPDIVNTIFGTSIKDRGGIKGRLGEMAGIGGVAQKAWTSLGTGAKNLAKAGLFLPAAGAGLAINSLYKKKFGENIADTKAGRVIRAIGSGVGTAAKTGSIMKSYESGKAAYEKTSATPLDKLRRSKQTSDEIDNILTNSDGNSIVNETDTLKKDDAIKDLEDGVRRYGGDTVSKANDKYQKRVRAANVAQSMAKNYRTILDENEKAAQHLELAGRSDLANKIRDMSGKFEAQGVNGTIDGANALLAMQDFIKSNQDLYNNQVVKNLLGENGKLTSMQRQYNYLNQKDADGKSLFGLTEKDLADLGRSEAAVSFLANTTLKGKVDSAKADLDIAIAGAGLSEMDKLSVEKYVANEADLNNSYGFAIGRKDGESNRNGGFAGLTDAELEAAEQIDNGVGSINGQQTSQTSETEATRQTQVIRDKNGNSIPMNNNTQPSSNGGTHQAADAPIEKTDEETLAALDEADRMLDEEKQKYRNNPEALREIEREKQRNAAKRFEINNRSLDE